MRAAWEQALAGPLAGRPVTRVVVTHHHRDHIGLAGWFIARGASLWTTRTAWLLARMLTLDVQARPTAEMLAFWRASGMPADMLAARAGTRPYNFADVVHPLPLGYRRLRQGDEIDAGGRRWRVEIGNGHAPEQATLWGVGHDLVIAGDQVLPGITPNIGVHPTEPEADPVGEWLASCQRLAALAHPGHFALPGHRKPFFGLDDRLNELAEHQKESLDRLEAFLAAGPRTATDCFETLFGRRIPDAIWGLALAEAVAHLNHLRATGRAVRRMGPDGAWLWRRDDFAPDSGEASR